MFYRQFRVFLLNCLLKASLADLSELVSVPIAELGEGLATVLAGEGFELVMGAKVVNGIVELREGALAHLACYALLEAT